MDTSFRRLPIDLYDEDRVLESELYTPDPRDPSTVLSDTRAKQGEVRGLLQRGDVANALVAALVEPPFGEGVEEAKEMALSVVVSVLNSTKSTDIPALVASLSPVDQVTLMKYLYKAMENIGDASGNVVLGWHEKLVEHAGTGCIVRVMTDRRRV